MAKLPYYKRYPRDYLSDENVALMSLEEEGAYNRLLDYCWLQGSIPSDLDKLARLCRTSPDNMKTIWPALEPCFERLNGERYTHPRLDEERAEAEDRSEKAREAARIGWEKRRSNSDGDADA